MTGENQPAMNSFKLAGVALGLTLGGLLLAAPAARAQDYETQLLENSTQNYNNNISVITNGIINKKMLDDAVARNNGSRGTAATTAKAASARRSFAYVPTAALQKQTAAAYVAKIRAADPAAAATVATSLAGKTNYPVLYHELNDGNGLRENDAADVMATYLVENWIIVNGITDGKLITPAKMQAVRAQTTGTLAGNSSLRSAAALAQFGEQLKLNTAMLEVGRLRSQHDGTSAAYRQKVATQLQSQFHLDMSQLQLTSRGLVKK